jgi:biofilm PGA synthesis lipoprotein PgaB
MPVLGFDLGDASMTVQTQAAGAAKPADYRRLSPFDPEARRLILEIYEDLARHAEFEGLLFHDDGYLTDFEDANPAALAFYRDNWQLPADIDAIRSDPDLMRRWSEAKTQALLAWTGELTERVRIWRPTVRTARNLYAETALNPASEAWYAQSLQKSLEHYDFAAVMAMPYMEQAVEPDNWLEELVDAVKQHPEGLQKTIFELQTFDWNHPGRKIPSATLVRQMQLLQRLGAVNFGYYPDDFIRNHPHDRDLHRAISMQTYPYRP